MQTLDRLTRLMGSASQAANTLGGTLGGLLRKTETRHFIVGMDAAFYLHTEYAEVDVQRVEVTASSSARLVIVDARWQPPMAWRVVSEQDDAGVYFVAVRHKMTSWVSGISSALGAWASLRLSVTAPPGVPLILRLHHTRLVLDDISGVIELPPDGTIRVER
jgi:hypothetical protein